MVAIKAVNLTKRYEDIIAVDGLNLEINEGELFSFLGVNGAGKTTTVKMLSTITRPTSGDAFIYGKSIVSDYNEVKGDIDLSMQETAIARRLTVDENIEFYARLNGLSGKEIDEAKKLLYKSFNVQKFANKQAQKLSGGWQRRLSVALSLISNPRVIFLDEPTLGLDVISRRELWETIRALKGKKTVVLTTHYMEEAEALSDRIGIMKDGRLLFVGSKQSLFQQTDTRSVEDAFIKIVTGGCYD